MLRFLLILIHFICLFAAVVNAEGPRLEASSADFNFGRVFSGQQVEHLFRITNRGDAELKIDRVRSSCGCTAALLSDKSLAPGKTAELKAKFDSTRFSGEVVKTVYLYSNDPEHPVTQLTMRGNVLPELVVRPRELDLTDLRPGEARDEIIEIENRGSRDLSFSSVTTTATEVVATLSEKTLAGGEKIQLRVRLEPGSGRDRLSAYVIVKCEQKNCDVRLPIFGRVLKGADPAK